MTTLETINFNIMTKVSNEEKSNNANVLLVAGLTCSRCKVVQKHFCDIVYSQGNKVCLECKKETLESDKRAFDRDMRFR